MEDKTMRRDILRLVIPIALENALQILAGIMTAAMVGRLAASDISAQGLSGRVYSTCYALFRGLGVGATIRIAFHYGKGDRGGCRRAAEQTYLTVLPVSVALAVICTVFSRGIISAITADAALLELAARYLRVSIWSIPFMTGIAINTASFHGHGDTKTPMFTALWLNLVNICVSFAAIFGLGPIKGMGIMGAALATIVSQAFGCAVGAYLLYRRRGGLLRGARHGRRFFSIDPPEISGVYSTGLPSSLESMLWQFSALLVSKVILGYGSGFYAAYQLGLQAEMITEMPATGFTVAAATLTTRAIAQKDGALYRTCYKNLVRISLAVGAISTLILLATPRLLMSALTDKQELREIGVVYLLVMALSQIPQVLSKSLNGVIRASGGKSVPAVIVFVGVWVIRVPLIMLVGGVLKWDIVWIWGIITLDQVSKLVMSWLYIKRKKLEGYVERVAGEGEA